MKVVISSSGPELTSPADPRFGRCAYFVLVESESMSARSYPNESRQASGGAGIQAGQFVASLGAEAVLTGNVGPNATRVLGAAGIKVYAGISGTVEEAVNDLKAGKLKTVSSATVGPHFGMGGVR
jgi:predicted Fe-Mo cluster-binding NifX family protein